MTMKRPWIVISCAAFIVTLAMGVRQAFGLFLPQMSISLGIGRESFGLAIAISNLVFGLAQPFVGALGDRYGAGRVVFAGTLALRRRPDRRGLGRAARSACISPSASWSASASPRPPSSIVLGAVGRVVPAERRGLAFGIVTAGGSLGQFLVVPGAQMLLSELGYRLALIVLAGLVALCAVLAIGVAGKPAGAPQEGPRQSLREALARGGRLSRLLAAQRRLLRLRLPHRLHRHPFPRLSRRIRAWAWASARRRWRWSACSTSSAPICSASPATSGARIMC